VEWLEEKHRLQEHEAELQQKYCQVKEKLLDAVYKGSPYSQRSKASDMDLGKICSFESELKY